MQMFHFFFILSPQQFQFILFLVFFHIRSAEFNML